MRVVIFLMLFSFVLGCKTKQNPISFMLLEKHSGKSPVSYKVIDGKVNNIYIYSETFLIDNLPERQKKGELDEVTYDIQKAYFEKNNKLCLVEDDITYYGMTFYRKSNCTAYFINHLQDHTGFSQTTFRDCKGDGEYLFYYERDKKNKNMWVLNQNMWGKEYHDTIYCKPNRKKLKLPDRPH
ncbi:hypothetical protein J2Q11_13420 [Tenacibaculum finnmarkense genomovar finnmarkense]|uniref:Lipoprotein n=1 Tax=Tenacibaculum finnmarkense genomovar finnmarkense TaxID=1458503 RepID=A0AAP1RHZ7_9FLAO|nr:hypothetical protein [Tenacibaculum finnmarkense]MBE7653920.1 hypothetical protein [Tenacibaculum finnmarkense genomovar finnmarkense]MBE7661013.1 hypothetical protein [Tenacibaculum finnmarkense genomovar finnmarkense]MBE7696222.1 hypothetical protein [Tenacibaculum finnmarkense genomovar finnmarkense]MCD8418694.1 hypothetical protein [Tenacibaculum finnmarkense genomovar finnmarkense]MCD8428310.1 hypothetical protein [Tenacibaculum finnmarkense genomovar finnmarkense]